MTAVLVLALAAQLVYGLLTGGKAEILGRTSSVTVQGLIDGTNSARQAAGLASLRPSSQLNQAAQLKAQDMFANQYWAHESPTGVTPWKWLSDVGYSYSVAGENLAKNFADSNSTVEAWLASDTHRANVLEERYSEVGFAVQQDVMNGRSTVLIVAYYGKPADKTVAVAGTQQLNLGGNSTGMNPARYFASALGSLTPASIFAILILGLVVVSAAVTHHYRHKLPKTWRKSWKAHHAAYKSAGALSVVVLLIIATGGGQI